MSGSILKTGALAALVIVGFSGCAKASKPPAEPQPAYGPVVVDVANHNWNTVVVYAYSDGLTQRLGEVNTGSTVSMDTPAGMDPESTDFQLIVDPIGSLQVYRTGRIQVNPGDVVKLDVENDLNLSSYSTSAATR